MDHRLPINNRAAEREPEVRRGIKPDFRIKKAAPQVFTLLERPFLYVTGIAAG
jgi:hypothetical protein